MSFIRSKLVSLRWYLTRQLKNWRDKPKLESKELTAEELAEITRRKYTKVSNYLFYFLGVICCYQAAAYFWNRIPYSRPTIPGLTQDELKQVRQPRQSTTVRNYSLFGIETPTPPTNINSNAPAGKPVSQAGPQKSRLNITITGISASSSATLGSVVLIYEGKEDTYGVGDQIPKTKAVIKKIEPRQIVIDNDGTSEFVVFDEDDAKAQQRMGSVKQEEPKKTNSDEIKNVRTELLTNPGKLFDYVSIKPAMRDGKTVGYELNPGKNNKLFIDAGLKAGDIAVDINGHDLTDNAQAMQLMGELQNLTSLTIVVDRDGAKETINLNLQ